jgi:predicted DNA-binding transcriptional regulator YafY
VIGYSETHGAVRTFGLDRISEPLKLKKKYHFTDSSEVDTYLNDVYGVFPIPEAALASNPNLTQNTGY